MMIQSTATRARWVAVAVIAGGAAIAITLAVRAAGSSGTDPPGPAARQETRSTEDRRSPMDEQQTARQKELRPMTTETVNDTGDGSKTQVTVNGESVTVPANGSYNRTTDDGSTRTEVEVNNRNQSTESGNSSSNHSSSDIKVNVRSGNGP